MSNTSPESPPIAEGTTGTGTPNTENTVINWNMTNALTENNAYNRIIYQSFKEDPVDRGYESNYTDKTSLKVNELVDVVSEYHWSIDSMKFGNGVIAFVPHCYAIEYQQRYSSSMTNLINSLVGFRSGLGKLGENLSTSASNLTSFLDNLIKADVSGVVNTIKDSVTSGIETVGKNLNGEATQNIGKYISNTFSNSINSITNPLITKTEGHYLQPYSLLYDMTPTGQRYCFPMVSNPPSFNLSNSYEANQDDTSVLSANSFFSKISSFASSIASFNRDLSQFNSFLSGQTTSSIYERSNIEKAKFFQYPQQTESYTISFPLFNTVKSKTEGNPEWMKNYKFILLFCMRNMIFRKDNTSYYPPLFYDLTIPGVIRQPFTYVESVKVQPHGLVRMLGCKKIFSWMSDDEFSVPVPEVWVVNITFKSLLATSANLILSALDDSIVASVKEENQTRDT